MENGAFVMKKTKLRIPYNYNAVFGFKDGLAIVNLNGKYAVIDAKANLVIAADYEEINWFQDAYLMVKRDGFYGLITKQNQPIIPLQYLKIEVTKDKKLLRLYTEEGFEYKYLNQVFKSDE